MHQNSAVPEALQVSVTQNKDHASQNTNINFESCKLLYSSKIGYFVKPLSNH